MRRLIYPISLLILALTACSKGNNSHPKSTNTVTINGTTYPTVTIGGQTWTSANYVSNGAVSYDGADFYTYAQATAIVLPSGWRIPTASDYNNLMTAAGGTLNSDGSISNANPATLMDTTGWQIKLGTNTLGFNAKAYGSVGAGPPIYSGGYGLQCLFWCALSSGQSISNTQVLLIQEIAGDEVGLSPYEARDYACLRFVKDN
jgi:uncharacterized protein (TIGR02145 family)